jgi:leucyl aminopeptidase
LEIGEVKKKPAKEAEKMSNILEDLPPDQLRHLMGLILLLPRVRRFVASDRPDFWVLTGAETLKDLVPEDVVAAGEALKQVARRSLTSLVHGPVLTANGRWVALAHPAADTSTGPIAYRHAFTALARQLRSLPVKEIVIGAEALSPEFLRAALEGFRLGWYRYPAFSPLEPPNILVPELEGCASDAFTLSELFSQATCLTRLWVEEAPNRLTPAMFADLAVRLGHRFGLSVDVFNPQQMRDMGMGGILAVGEGSKNLPRVVVLRHLPDRQPELGLVGKGITFDSGGISLKPSQNLRKLKGDKAGASAVLAACLAAAQMGVSKPFIGILPLAENMPSDTAYRPGDVVTMLDGTTVDVVSTDAEGRMVLADGIALAIQYGCKQIVTLATLTKACIVALGNFRAALYSPDDQLAKTIVAAGESVGELMWRMPLDEVYAHSLKSPVADLCHSGEGGGGSIVAAKFLQHFARSVSWAHIDMSSIFYLDTEMPWGEKGYTGAGARLALALIVS